MQAKIYVNLTKKFYEKNYRSIYNYCEEHGRDAWNTVCPVKPHNVSYWKKKLDEEGYLGSGPGKTRHRNKKTKPKDVDKVLT